MAGKSLGTLTIDLIAKTGGFVSGLNQAERASAKWSKQVQADAASASTALAGIGAAAVTAGLAVGAAGFQLLKSTSKQITETDRWAKSLRISTQELLAWQFAAEKAGVSGDQMADIFKDIGDKIGDAVLNKSGEAVDALNALGLSAEKLSKVSPDKQLLAIGESLSKIGTNAEKTTILESLGNDLSKLLPLFDNNNQKLKQFIDLAKDYGVAPDPSSIDDLVKVNQLFEDMEAQVAGLKMEIAAGLAKVDLTPLQNSLDKLHDVLTDPVVLQGISNLVSEVAQLAGWLVKAAAGAGQLAASTGNRFAALSGKIDLNNIDQVNERITYLQKNLEGRKGFYSQDKSMFAWFTGGDDSVKALNDELNTLIQTREKLSKPVVGNLPLGSATVGADNPFALPKGGTNGKVTPDANAKKLESAFKALETSYQRQIALIDTTGKKNQEVTELEKLRFDFTSGKLAGINDAQKVRLEQLATEVDRLNSLKKANEENLKLVEFASNLRKQNQNDKSANDADFIGSGMGDKTRQRMKELLDIQRSFLERQSDLQKQYQSGDISKSLYDQETTALQQALNDRLEIQEDYYKKSDAQMGDWQSGIMDALNDYADSSADYYQTAADAMSSILGGATSAISDNINDLVHSAEDLGDFFSNIFSSLGETIIKTLSDMAAQWLVYQGVQLLVGKSTQASAAASMIANAQASSLQAQIAAYASTAAIPIVGPALAPAAMATAAAVTAPLVAAVGTSALAGMAHDGIDSVPETGTWLLQKGERVVTSQTSAKLDETLDRVNQQSTHGANFSPVINMNVNGDPSDTQIAMMKQATAEGAKLGYQQAASDLASGKGDISKAMMRWNTNRRTG
ncbi:TPA: phage tail tape measure protein [Enterobacter hormaechei]|uniref:phage tail tape measure protein n=4 Tax=Enterobacter hormaechei TaxID=158836 RepID=UPI000735353A|nr:phage tail tape measure protein [Enterobacter hormaechei]MDU4564702.1 phage tail tape measure protein [Klebsiella oxytoca]KTK07453.1 tail length tape measure protein [Enterobacter hormaechei subsp. oharae]KTK12925.1 tail length tape measure protein [Enterobacter hormaechei subsp. oharae]MBK2957926.1 phage tail tape measure protein [Enterobacter hormaechei]MCE1507552.1 phage tail tape measure protein [Enterobacter hormaechei]